MLTLNILGPSKRREALCPTCVYAVTQKGFKGEELTSCGYGGLLRELKWAVCECSVYADRRIIRPQAVAGFVKPAAHGKSKVTVIRIV